MIGPEVESGIVFVDLIPDFISTFLAIIHPVLTILNAIRSIISKVAATLLSVLGCGPVLHTRAVLQSGAVVQTRTVLDSWLVTNLRSIACSGARVPQEVSGCSASSTRCEISSGIISHAIRWFGDVQKIVELPSIGPLAGTICDVS
ncbi:hypothetical protein [Lacunimicrobium album]